MTLCLGLGGPCLRNRSKEVGLQWMLAQHASGLGQYIDMSNDMWSAKAVHMQEGVGGSGGEGLGLRGSFVEDICSQVWRRFKIKF